MATFRMRGRRDIVKCPRCGYRFSITYSRAFACSGCFKASLSCEYVKCPECGFEFTV